MASNIYFRHQKYLNRQYIWLIEWLLYISNHRYHRLTKQIYTIEKMTLHCTYKIFPINVKIPLKTESITCMLVFMYYLGNAPAILPKHPTFFQNKYHLMKTSPYIVLFFFVIQKFSNYWMSSCNSFLLEYFFALNFWSREQNIVI